jgi:hypothetical protein
MDKDELSHLLDEAAAADGLHRIDYRDSIARFGDSAVARLEPWLRDSRLAAFAVRTIAAAGTSGAASAPTVLERARSSVEGSTRDDIDSALSSLRRGPSPHEVRSQSSPDVALGELRVAIEEWRQRGSPPQGPTAWRKADWIAAFPAHAAFLRRQPTLLDRVATRSAASRAAVDRPHAETALLISKAWGEGENGYGPSRALESFERTPSIGDRLLAVARTLRDHGASAACARLVDGADCRVFNLGPAFGTKFLYFSQPDGQRPQALIHDRVVAAWLRTRAGLALDPTSWSVSTYSSYLQVMHRWALELDCEPDEVELCIFRSSLPPASRWAGI